MARVTLAVVMAAFFSGLALDIAVPAVVLSAMGVSTWLVRVWPEPRVSSGSVPKHWKGRPA